MSSADELEKLTVTQLREKLKSYNLPVTGTKAVLIKRLLEHNEESLLKDDEDAHSVKDIVDLDEELLNDDTVKEIKNGQKSENGTTIESIDEPKKEEKKESNKEEEVKNSENTKQQPLVKKRINVEGVVELDDERKMKLKRAERFNLPAENVLTDDEKKKLREERFKDAQQQESQTLPVDDIEAKRKERAKRFGIPEVSVEKNSTLSSVSGKKRKQIKFGGEVEIDADKLAARAKRFGITTNTVSDLEEKKKKRLERFGLSTA
ncbi:CIP29 protein [Strongyloides ratti]|uniref:CIP29 protein n=1 Tax=Strongyloides ratti TaxID=34506 RepID=A0A090L7N4_STRRB|nr:CIP29 protein [Strongyloides ratti]CEF65806.1 CIP29 protein [Strongyloides ratti]